jgi:hypothetical protein
MRIQSNHVYLNAFDSENGIYGVIPKRMWWKPWRWQVVVILTDELTGNAGYIYRWQEYTVRNLSYSGAVGMMKLYGVVHRDLENNKAFT